MKWTAWTVWPDVEHSPRANAVRVNGKTPWRALEHAVLRVHGSGAMWHPAFGRQQGVLSDDGRRSYFGHVSVPAPDGRMSSSPQRWDVRLGVHVQRVHRRGEPFPRDGWVVLRGAGRLFFEGGAPRRIAWTDERSEGDMVAAVSEVSGYALAGGGPRVWNEERVEWEMPVSIAVGPRAPARASVPADGKRT